MTVLHHLQLITDDDIRRRALKNLFNERSGDRANSIEHAIFVAFLWHMTPEKFTYWKVVHHNFKNPNDLMPVPVIDNVKTKKSKL